MTTVYVDTGGFIALLWSRDRAHASVRDAFALLRDERTRFVTCDPVIGETATRLRYDAGLDATRRFEQVVERSVDVGQLMIRESSSDLRRAAFELMATYDGLRLSYADAVGAVTARQSGAAAVLGLDDDFRVLGFRLLPADRT